ncbi:STAS domain-containing protein [Vallicoccus soli]|uniref:Anti-sigma factor antagonist n=1 Tax=Vallicoccus soli TaxID=2339232 RepID=A0A3A3ZBG2_9ACTN|nr:anti-sigma factor antagonist [Vallicoccus soli]
MTITADTTPDGPVLVLAGRLDVATVADVRDALQRAIESGEGPAVVDLAGVEVADATGLGVLVGAHRRAGRAGRTLVLRHVPPRLARLLTATRLHRILQVEDVLPESLRPAVPIAV